MTVASPPADEERIVKMLRERGVNRVRELLADLGEYKADDVLGTIAWWDDQRADKRTTGLLVHRLREGGVPGYVRAHERTGPAGELVLTDEVLDRVWGACLSPDGMLNRTEAAQTWAWLIKKAHVSADDLLKAAGLEDWQETPPHPAKLDPGAQPDPYGSQRYAAWVVGDDEPDRPDVAVRRREDESLREWAWRFWRYEDPPELIRVIERMTAAAAAAELERRRQAEREAEMEKVKREADQRRTQKAAEAAKAEDAELEAQRDERYGETIPEDEGDLW